MTRGMGGLAMHALELYYETPESVEGGNASREKRKPEFRNYVKYKK
jgi:2-ketocyclohexanecarboxyl-CoA hydrolase